MFDISIVITHWNTPDLLDRQLSALTGESGKLQIIVVDNASDKPLDWIEQKYPTAKFIKNKINRGYAFACNQGVIRAKGAWLLFLNPDVEITSAQIRHIIIEAEEKKLDSCAPQTTSAYQKPLPSPLSLLAEFTPLGSVWKAWNLVIGTSEETTLFGGCLLIKKNVLEKLGGWDERFSVWFEDSDLTTRLLQSGYRIGLLSQHATHRGGQSFHRLNDQTKRDIFFHSMDVYAKKHFSLFGQWIVSLIKRRYSQRNILPALNEGIAITIPNVKKELLAEFFSKNEAAISSNHKTEWIIVTSSVKEDELWSWRKRYPHIRFIPIDRNRGFAATVNIGFRAAPARWIGTVNDDVILNNKWLQKCLACAKTDRKIGSINPVIYDKNGKIESAGIEVLAKGKAIPLTYLSHDREIDTTNAAAVLYSNGALDTTGLFDERFGSYLEDIDLSLRLRRKGFRNIVCPKASVIHRGHSSSSILGARKQWHDLRNWIYIIVKNWGVRRLIRNFFSILIERMRNISGLLKKLV